MWQEEGINPPKAVIEATKEYPKEMNPLKGFFEDCCIFGEQYQISKKEIYDAYTYYCKENDIKNPLNKSYLAKE